MQTVCIGTSCFQPSHPPRAGSNSATDYAHAGKPSGRTGFVVDAFPRGAGTADSALMVASAVNRESGGCR